MSKNLSEFSYYVTEKIKTENLLLSEYITTDNILQNKKGKVNANTFPVNVISVTKYNSGDILLSNIRPYLKKIWFSNQSGGCSSDVLVFRAKNNIDSSFLYYSMFRDDFFQHVLKGSKGTKMPRGDKGQIMEFRIPDFELKNQKKIAEMLSAIDKKIELNNRINAELEAMAKTLYDYWFVQFDFPYDFVRGKPDANGKPYKTSGGKMVYNSNLKRHIPEGWEAVNVLKVAHLFGGGTPTKTKADFWNGEIPFFTPSDSDLNVYCLKTEDYITQVGLKNSSTRIFPRNTVFITARGSVGRLALNAVPMAMNQSCYALQAKEGISYAYLFYLIKELIHHLEIKASGSVFNSIVSNDIEYTNLAIPSTSELIKVYATIAEPIFEKIRINIKENCQLEELRDWLLPMLMNGQVTIKP